MRALDILRNMTRNLHRIALRKLWVDLEGWLRGPGVTRIPIHRSWYYAALSTPGSQPIGCMWHYTDTRGGARNMAERRTKPVHQRPEWMGLSSWHVTVDKDGHIYQMVPLTSGAWHCGKGRVGGHRVNKALIGIELVGKGRAYPVEQVKGAERLLDAMVSWQQWERGQCVHEHRDFDPQRRSDCGPPWTDRHLPRILDRVF